MTAGIGMACAGAAGALIAPMFDTQPFLATDFTLIAFIIVIVGGLGSLTGALIGGVLIGVAEASRRSGIAGAQDDFLLRLAGAGPSASPERPVRGAAAVTGVRASSPWPALGFFAAMAAAGPLMDGFWQSLLTFVFFYAFMGLTWNLMMSAGLLSLGHALFLGLGAYATAVFTAAGGLSPWLAIAAGAASRRSPAAR